MKLTLSSLRYLAVVAFITNEAERQAVISAFQA